MTLKASLGACVDLELMSKTTVLERLTVELVPDQEADFDAGQLGVSTPLAQAILGRAVGALVPYRRGDIEAVRIVTVTPDVHRPTDEVTANRQAVIQTAINKSDQANAIQFALTVENKWGGYDPTGIESSWDES